MGQSVLLSIRALRPYPRGVKRREATRMDSYFLVGAIMGSGLFIALGREPAERLLRAVQDRLRRTRP